MRIGLIIISHLSNLWKAKFSILCDVILRLRLQEKFDIDHSHFTPLQGDAVFWYNLKKSGDGDDSTRHAACPVLVGNKWGEWCSWRIHGNQNDDEPDAIYLRLQHVKGLSPPLPVSWNHHDYFCWARTKQTYRNTRSPSTLGQRESEIQGMGFQTSDTLTLKGELKSLTSLKPWPNCPPNSSQLEPSSQLRWSWVSFGQPLYLSWLEFDQARIFA